MKTNDAVKEIMREKGIGSGLIAARMGKTQRLVCDRLSQSNISVEKLCEILRVLDCKVVIIPRDVPTPKGGYEIE